MDAKVLIQEIRKAIGAAATSQTGITFVDLDRYLAELEKNVPIGSFSPEQLKFTELKHQSSLEMFRSVIASGQNALKTSLLINGGASVALLAFIGHLATSSTTTSLVFNNFAYPLSFFLGGTLATAIASGLNYVSQAFFHCNCSKTGNFFNWLSILLVTGSYFAFAFGCYRAYKIFLP